MSSRRDRYRDRTPSPDPFYIERKPASEVGRVGRSPTPPARQRRKSVSFDFSLNPFRRRQRTVVIKESVRNRKREGRQHREPSSSPSPPRGPDHIMDKRVGEHYEPLPKKLPARNERDSSTSSDNGKKKKKWKPKVIQVDPEDRDAFPRIEKAEVSRERPDSGIFSMEGSPRPKKYYDAYGRPAYPSSSGSSELADHYSNLLNQKEAETLEAKRESLKHQKAAEDLRTQLEQLKRSHRLDERESRVASREREDDEYYQRQLQQPPTSRLVEVRPHITREVIISQPNPPVRYSDPYAPIDDPLQRARQDEKRRSGRYP